ncbi:hypothetical protein F4804DRAFT_333604 [Jackrogersella minutella]|nr:hypothetical protein F4804DRAFT_333604 [Jackrogersella minutella]
MRFFTSILALGIHAVVVLAAEDQIPTTTLKIADEPLPVIVGKPFLELRSNQGDLRTSIRKGTRVASELCFHSVEQLEEGADALFAPYSLEELVAVKEKLEKSGYCSSIPILFDLDDIDLSAEDANEPQPDPDAHWNGPRCVSAILPNPESAETSPDPNISSAGFEPVSTIASIIALTALFIL